MTDQQGQDVRGQEKGDRNLVALCVETGDDDRYVYEWQRDGGPESGGLDGAEEAAEPLEPLDGASVSGGGGGGI